MQDAWIRLSGEMVFDAGIFRLFRDRYRFRGEETRPFYVLRAAPWANVVAVTPADEVVLVRQFRHGVQAPSLEVAGGIVDPGDAGPEAAAARELLEETGYRATALRPLGSVTSNPAILDNRTHFFAAENAVPGGATGGDALENIEVVLCPVAGIRALIRTGEIHHSLSVAALSLYLLDRADA